MPLNNISRKVCDIYVGKKTRLILLISRFRLYCPDSFSELQERTAGKNDIEREGMQKERSKDLGLIDGNLIKHKFQRPTRYL